MHDVDLFSFWIDLLYMEKLYMKEIDELIVSKQIDNTIINKNKRTFSPLIFI